MTALRQDWPTCGRNGPLEERVNAARSNNNHPGIAERCGLGCGFLPLHEVSYGIQGSRKTQEHLPQRAGAMGAGSVRHRAGACRFLSGDFLRERVMSEIFGVANALAEKDKRIAELEQQLAELREAALLKHYCSKCGMGTCSNMAGWYCGMSDPMCGLNLPINPAALLDGESDD